MSKIEWTNETWNPMGGCSWCSEGCDGCYAAGVAFRGMVPLHRGLATKQGGKPARFTGELRYASDDVLERPFHWRRPRRVFVNSMSDLFHPDVHGGFIDRVWDVMERTPQHQYQVLTKRPQRARTYLNAKTEPVLPNVWLGTSIELDKYAWRANVLRETEAAVKFISAEPLLSPLPSLDLSGIDWLIVGGESGPWARPMHEQWALDLLDLATNYRVAFFMKQAGAHLANTWGCATKAGHDLDRFPRELQVRQYPQELVS